MPTPSVTATPSPEPLPPGPHLPRILRYWLPVECLDCHAAIFIGKSHPAPDVPVRGSYCGECGSRHLVDRDPTSDDEEDYFRLRMLRLEVQMEHHRRWRNARRAKRLMQPGMLNSPRLMRLMGRKRA